jgi:hypothetical protein
MWKGIRTMKKLLALGAVALSLALGAPASAQMESHTTRVVTPAGTSVTRTVDRPNGSHTEMHREMTHNPAPRVTVRRTVVRHTVNNTGWHRGHRQCATRWHNHRRVTRCWTR